ncbi:MAG: DUF2834 domain-containing protein, partial [Sphingomonadaceae bacterium]|nr:DUF2834 domain-containing protein [Sphingomonadaceae bacterium]
MKIRHTVYALAAIASLIWVWSLAFDWIGAGGNILNLPSFFIDAYQSGSAAGFLTIDILVVWGAFMLWVIPDARRIGLGTKTGLTFLLLSFLGTCFA